MTASTICCFAMSIISSDIQRLRRDIVFRCRLRDMDFEFHSTWGLFSPRGIDEGSRLLIEYFDALPDQATLEIGCGYGPIGMAIARQSPRGQVHMVDRDYVAVEYAGKNVALNGLKNCRVYLSNAFSAVPPRLRFDNVVSNLPAKGGGEMLSIILHDAHERLLPNGRLCVVTVSGLRRWIERNMNEVFGNYRKLKQGKSHTVALAVKGGP